jgi:GntR family transcriptional regulator/MocR family aminotransferase
MFMPAEWSGLRPELLLALNRRAAEPLRSQLESKLRGAIRSGRLQVGERLPSSRELARESSVCRAASCRTAMASCGPRDT